MTVRAVLTAVRFLTCALAAVTHEKESYEQA